MEEKTYFKILLVDDHPLVCEGLATLLKREENLLICGQATHVAEALALLQKEEPHLVIVDISLQGLSGLELLSRMRDIGFKGYSLVFSMHDELIYAEKAIGLGAQGYVMKQKAATEVVAAVRTILAGGFFFSHAVQQRMHRTISLSSPAKSEISSLTSRELETLHLIAQGLKSKQIALELHVSIKTIDSHIANMKQKLHLASSLELAQFAALWSHRS